jgi:ubiquinone/menaquinone biosynthesis C-methylase UbiE
MKDDKGGERLTQIFYNSFWPKNVPDIQKAREHTLRIVPDRKFTRALDAGCGSGVSSIALLDRSKTVVSIDLSEKSLETARVLSSRFGKKLELVSGSLMNVPFKDDSFDLVYCYGVVSLTSNPYNVVNELVKLLCKDGYIILSVLEKTNLSPIHKMIQNVCLRMPNMIKAIFLKVSARTIAGLVKILTLRSKDYDLSIESKLEDYYFVPYKHYFKINEIKKIFEDSNLEFTLISRNTGRFKSSSHFIVMGKRYRA